jgi:ribosomal protein L35AE/L33A
MSIRNAKGRNIDDINEAITFISGAFIWRDTPQGAKYWEDVIKNLEVLANE